MEKVAIIGGGVSGLCAALALQLNGVEVDVYDPSHYSSSDGGFILGGNAIQSLSYLGLGPIVEKISMPFDSCNIYSEQGALITKLSDPISKSTFLSFHSFDFQQMLNDALKPGTVHYNKELTRFSQSENIIQLSFRDGTTYEANYLIACDGADSFIRSQIIPEIKSQFSGLTCWYGTVDWKDEKGLADYSETWGPRGLFGMAPLPHHKVCWYAVKKEDVENEQSWSSIDLLFNFFSYHEPVQTILEKTEHHSFHQKRLARFSPMPKYHFGRILLLGDCAHAVPPHLGQNHSQVIEDALYLVKWVNDTTSLGDAYKKYEQARLPRTTEVVTEMKRLHKLAQLDKPALCSIRNYLFKFIPESFHQKKLRNIFDIKMIQ